MSELKKAKPKGICDICKKTFSLELQKKVLGKDKKGGDVVQHYFVCPHCNHHFYTFVSDSVYEAMCAEHKRLKGKTRNRPNDIPLSELNAYVESCLKEADDYMKTKMLPYHAKLQKKYANKSKGNVITNLFHRRKMDE